MKLTVALLAFAVVLLSATVMAQDEVPMPGGGMGEDYIHLPGKSCADAPPCPDGRPCVMAPPHCNKGTCGTDLVPTCGKKP